MRIIDVSVEVREGMAVYPGEPKVSFNRRLQIGSGDPANVSFLTMGCHTGTHVDAPFHFFDGGPTSESLSPDLLIGEAYVLDVGAAPSVTVDMLRDGGIPVGVKRVLLKTRNSAYWSSSCGRFVPDYVYLEKSASEWLVNHSFVLVGIDYLNIDSFSCQTPHSHMVLLRNGIIIVEGLNLAEVEAGTYELCCLPLKLKGLDGSPARVVLIRR